jgi:hypothetical protein
VTTGDPRQPALVVSVHDVSPLHVAGVRWLLARLDALGIRRRVLKVIPRDGGTAPLADDAGLVALLREEVTGGAEIVLHGYTHRSEGRLRGSSLQRLRASLFAGDSAEFLSLSRAEALVRVQAGLAAIEEVGIRPIGFCPPAWLADRRLPSVLRECGMRYLVTFSGLRDLERRRRRTIPAVGYLGAGPVQEQLVAVERVLVLAAASRLPVVRVFLHPQGAASSRACGAVLRALEPLVATRAPVTYAALLDA